MPSVEDKTLSVWQDQINVRVKISGSGPPAVFLHGPYGLEWDSFLDSLSASHTVYAPEHPGTTPGDPDAVKPLDGLWDLVLLYYELFNKLGLDAPAVVGHSYGGMLAAELAATNPASVSKLALINPIGLWRDDAPVKNWMSMSSDQVAEASYFDPDGPAAKAFTELPEDADASVDAQLYRVWSLSCTGKFIWPIPDKGLKKRINRITAPTLVIWGEHDKLVSPVYAEEFAKRIAGSRVEMVADAAHVPHVEQQERVSQIVEAFLRA